RSARRRSSASLPWAARMRSASTRTWERSICAASASSAPPVSPRGCSVDAKHAEDYLASLKHQRRLAPATLQNYRRALGMLLALREGRPLGALEPTEVRRAIALLHAKGLSPRTLALVQWRALLRSAP